MSMIQLSELIQQAERAHQEVQKLMPIINTRHELDKILAVAHMAAPDLHFNLTEPAMGSYIGDLVPFVRLEAR